MEKAEREVSIQEKVWTTLRRNNIAYTLNKLISFGLAIFFAVWTITYKGLVWEYTYNFSEPRDYNYTVLYYLLFYFYSMQAVDEMCEMYTVYAEREKGAIGLMFELNSIVGILAVAYSIYIVYFHGI